MTETKKTNNVILPTGTSPVVFWHGDSNLLMKHLPASGVQLIFTSPEYPGLRKNRQTVEEWLAWFSDEFIPEAYRILRPEGVLGLNVNFKRLRDGFWDHRIFTEIIPRALTCFRGVVQMSPWIKPNPVPVGRLRNPRYDFPGWEPVFLFAKTGEYYYKPVTRAYAEKTVQRVRNGNPRGRGVANAYDGGRARLGEKGARQPDYWMYSSSGDQNRPRAYGGSFPRQLAERAICSFTREGDVVFDPFSGVGTTMLAAVQNGRKALGIEIDREEIEKGAKWVKEETGLEAVVYEG